MFSGFREVEIVPANQRPGQPFFPIGPKNTNLKEDVKILLPFKFRWIAFSGFRGEFEHVSSNQRPGRPSCFSDRHEKHQLGRGLKIFLPVKFRWSPFSSAVSKEKSKMSQPVRGQGGHLVFFDRLEKHKLGRGRWDLASCPLSLKYVQLFQKVEIA